MDGWIWPDHDYAWLAFFVLDGLGAAAAVATGRAFARSWSPQWQIAPAMIVLAAGVQWLHFALFQEDLLSPQYYFGDPRHPARRGVFRLSVDARSTDVDTIFLGLRKVWAELARPR